MPTFNENSRIQAETNIVGRAVMKLSMEGYIVLSTSAKRETIFSIQLDSPYEGPATNHQETLHAEKLIGSCEAFGCRLYWMSPESEAAA